jgi:hypothetical protein
VTLFNGPLQARGCVEVVASKNIFVKEDLENVFSANSYQTSFKFTDKKCFLNEDITCFSL